MSGAGPVMETQCSERDRWRGGKQRKAIGRQEWAAVYTAVRKKRYYRVLILSLIRSLCKSQQSQEMPRPWLQLIATAITKEGFL